MSNSPSKILDDFAKLMTDAAGAAKGVRGEVETAVRVQAETILNKLNLVHRDEFEVIKEIALKASSDAQALAARVEELEKLLQK